MDYLQGRMLVDKTGRQVPVTQALQGKTAVAFYFSAHWCPPCRQFTPLLAQAYSRSRSPGQGGSVEVIFVSSDRSPPEMEAYLKEAHGNWWALPHGDPASSILSSQFSVRGIPALKVVGLGDGSLISEDGRQEVMSLGVAAFARWESIAPAPVDVSIVNLLLENEPAVKREACDILLRLLGNIVRNPGEIKYRQIKLSNPKIESKLLPAAGAFEVLFEVGFEEDDDKLLLPLSASVAKVENFVKAIEKLDAKTAGGSQAAVAGINQAAAAGGSQSSAAAGGSQAATAGGVSQAAGSSLLMPDVLAREKEFLGKLVGSLQHMLKYEEPPAQAAALAVMPVARFESTAREKLERARAGGGAVAGEVPDSAYRDFLLLEFKEWFKTDFFKWVDAPKCPSCGGDTTSRGMLAPTPQEAADGAGRVEGYTCNTCGGPARFPRYHGNPAKLLETRAGRCGEWANCFVLCCRALGFDTRHVHDWTDHVWAEVWSESESRWLHVDPGETVDKPLVYEAGWGKKLTYVIASSKDEIQDVTWRYSRDHVATKTRRNLVRPKWLLRTLLRLTEDRQRNYSEDERSRLRTRRIAECLELLTPRKVGDADRVGRQTGSLSWRLARGEAGTGGEDSHGEEVVLSPTAGEVAAGELTLEYRAAADEYRRSGGHVTSGWWAGVFQSENIGRKVEGDHNMVYLARREHGGNKGNITWKFQMCEGVSVGRVELLVTSSVFQSGRVIWQLCGESSCLLPQPGATLDTEQLSGSREVKLTAMLSGGDGDVAWQHAQLFRCSRNDESSVQLRIKIHLKKETS